MQIILSIKEFDALKEAASSKAFFEVEALVPMRDMNRAYAATVVSHFNGNASTAAEALGIHRQTLANLLREPE